MYVNTDLLSNRIFIESRSLDFAAIKSKYQPEETAKGKIQV
jgi:hypothetical protein